MWPYSALTCLVLVVKEREALLGSTVQSTRTIQDGNTRYGGDQGNTRIQSHIEGDPEITDTAACKYCQDEER